MRCKITPDKVTADKHYLMTKNDWKAFYLFSDGDPTADNGEVPTTRRMFNNELKDWLCPLLEMHFSILESGAVIAPHCDLWHFTINLHFAVDIWHAQVTESERSFTVCWV
jgi:hypothetical protein